MARWYDLSCRVVTEIQFVFYCDVPDCAPSQTFIKQNWWEFIVPTYLKDAFPAFNIFRLFRYWDRFNAGPTLNLLRRIILQSIIKRLAISSFLEAILSSQKSTIPRTFLVSATRDCCFVSGSNFEMVLKNFFLSASMLCSPFNSNYSETFWLRKQSALSHFVRIIQINSTWKFCLWCTRCDFRKKGDVSFGLVASRELSKGSSFLNSRISLLKTFSRVISSSGLLSKQFPF